MISEYLSTRQPSYLSLDSTGTAGTAVRVDVSVEDRIVRKPTALYILLSPTVGAKTEVR